MNCPNCHAVLKDDAKFCGVCGMQLAAQPQPVNPPAAQPYGGYQPAGDPGYGEPPQKKSRKPVWIAVIALLLVAAIVVGVILIVQNNVSEKELQIAKEKYIPPAEAVSIDLTKDDPSNDQIKFEFFDDTRISSCTYSVDGIEYYQSYAYDDEKEEAEITTNYKNRPINIYIIPYGTIPEPNKFVNAGGYIIRLTPKNGKKTSPTEAAADTPTQAPTEALTEPPTEAPTQAPDVDFIGLYRNYLNETDFPLSQFCLIYVNDDDVPEMLMVEGSQYDLRSDIHTARLCWIENGEVRDSGDLIESMHGYMYYREREGLLKIVGGSGRASAAKVYAFDGSSCVMTANYGTVNTDTGTDYHVGVPIVSKEEFDAVAEQYDMTEQIPYGAGKADMDVYFAEFSGRGAYM